jgi:prepilin-type N-terminal cleavage/methylation domain-containing protein
MRIRTGSKAKNRQQGYSAVEMIIVVAIIAVLSAVAIMQTMGSTYNSKANSAMFALITQLRTARELALSKRRNVLVTLTAPNEIQLTVETLPGEAAATPIQPVYLNDNIVGGDVFALYPGLPDTPMGFGNSTAINFAPASGGSAGLAVMFSTSGELVGTTAGSGFNTVGNSNPVNASIFTCAPVSATSPTCATGKSNTARAVTVFGSTGRVRAYSWTGTSWQEEQ